MIGVPLRVAFGGANVDAVGWGMDEQPLINIASKNAYDLLIIMIGLIQCFLKDHSGQHDQNKGNENNRDNVRDNLIGVIPF